MRGAAPPVEKQFDRGLREACLDVFMHELIRHAVEMVIDLDVIIDVKCGPPHLTSSVAFLLMWPSVPFCTPQSTPS